MATVTVNDSNLYDIADSIRAKLGVQTTYKPSQMADAIDAISGGGITPTGTISITQNGTTDVTNYASASVSVPNSYSASDEGKVVSNGALVSQTSDTVTANDTYDTTLINSLTVNVSGGGGGATMLYCNIVGNQAIFYAEDMILDATAPNGSVKLLQGAAYLKKIKFLKNTALGGTSYQVYKAFYNCPLLESVQVLNGFDSGGYCEDIVASCPNIKEFIVGDIGYPNTVGMGPTSGSYQLFRNITIPFDIIIYTTATSLSDVPAILTNGSPWGATNATIIYKNSETGAVLT